MSHRKRATMFMQRLHNNIYNNKSLYSLHLSLYIILWKLAGHDRSLSHLNGCSKEDSDQFFSMANGSAAEERHLGSSKTVVKI